MVAIMRHQFVHLAAGLDHPHSFGKLVPNAIDLDIDEIDSGRGSGGGGGSSRHGLSEAYSPDYPSEPAMGNPNL